MKKLLFCFIIIASVLCISASAMTHVAEYEGFTATWTNGEVYIEGKGALSKKAFSCLFAMGCEGFEFESTDEKFMVKVKKIELSEGITEVPRINYGITVNDSAIISNFVLPSTVTNFDRANTYNIEKITVHKDNPVYASLDGVLYSKDMSTLLLYPARHPGKHLEIPKGVVRLEESCVYNTKYLESVVVPEGVETIPISAFAKAEKLNRVKLPASVKSIEPYAFENSPLVEVQIPDGVETIPDTCFSSPKLERIYIPASVKKIESAGVNTTNLKFVYYGGSAEDWKNIEIKNIYTVSLNDFSGAVFRYNATGLPEVPETLEVTPLNDKYPSGYLNDDKTAAWYVDEDYILHVHGYGKIEGYSNNGAYKRWAPYTMEANTYHLKGLIVHEGITEIGSYAFDTFTYDYIELPTTIKKIGWGAFYFVFCDKLVFKGCLNIGEYTFPRLHAKEIILPDNLNVIGGSCFIGAMVVTELTLPKSIKYIGSQALPSSLTDIYYEGSEKDWAKVNKPSGWGKITVHFMTPSFFVDVPTSHWAYQYIKPLYDAEIIGGTSPTTYEPDGTLTWGQALKLLLSVAGHGNLLPTREHWASGFLDYAKFRQWVHPDEINDAGLDTKITRLRFCQLAAGVKMIVAQPKTNPFTDTDDVMVLALYNAGIIGGTTKTTFSPDEFLTRAQIAKIIYLLRDVK